MTSSNKSDKVSVVTVTYNCKDILPETIQSVVKQDYNNVEYIIVDGESADGTVDIIRHYESQISKWISEPDKGIYDAMNKAIGMATGEWIIFMNAGDRFASRDVLSNVFLGKKYDSDIGIVYGDTWVLTQLAAVSSPFVK